MLTELRCIHDMNPADCAFCAKPPPRPAPVFAQPSGLGPWITAGYSSECAGESTGCLGGIDPGDDCRADGHGGWLCFGCGEVADDA